jgi:hypothetical protein
VEKKGSTIFLVFEQSGLNKRVSLKVVNFLQISFPTSRFSIMSLSKASPELPACCVATEKDCNCFEGPLGLRLREGPLRSGKAEPMQVSFDQQIPNRRDSGGL